jgi:hypothetical protein
MKWDKQHKDKGKHSKFQKLCFGPYLLKEKFGLGTYILKNLEGEVEILPVNGQALKKYFSYMS